MEHHHFSRPKIMEPKRHATTREVSQTTEDHLDRGRSWRTITWNFGCATPACWNKLRCSGRTGVRDRTGTKKMWGCLKSMGTPPLLQWSRTSISPVKVAFFLCGGISSFRHTRKFPYILLAISFIYCVTLCNYIPLHPPNISMTTVPINLDDWTSPFFMVIGEMVISPLYTIKSSMCLHLYPFVLVQESWLMW